MSVPPVPAATADTPSVEILGVRHHGPGSARSLGLALDAIGPDCVLVEGPPEADRLIPLVADPGMLPPVALVVYRADAPRDAAFYPFASFSPEWVALRHAIAAGIPARFIDLPRSLQPGTEDGEDAEAGAVATDPLGELARAAGHDDGERWWDAFVESRHDNGIETFAAVAEAMAALREGHVAAGREARREAHMRDAIREAVREGFRRIVVVCGAWHVPALLRHDARGQAGEDARLLRGLPRTRMEACWAPWSYERLASSGGYAAGVTSPEWYHGLWEHPGDPSARWLSRVAGLLRAEDHDASSASVIEATRLAGALAALRGRERPLLDDLRESALSVLCGGDPGAMGLIHRRLVVGLRLGTVPDAAPRTPVEASFAADCKAARIQAEAGDRDIVLDLRTPLDLRRSQLLHRLNLIGVAWGTRQEAKGTGTFKEGWALAWRPEFTVDLVAASAHGATVADAATALALERASATETVSGLATLALGLLDADLPLAGERITRLLNDRAAEGGDVLDLMRALPTLANLLRYGSVRGSDPAAVRPVVDGIVARVAAGLPYACQSLDDDAAATVVSLLSGSDAAVCLLEDIGLTVPWRRTLALVSEADTVHGLVVGKATRLLSDAGELGPGEAGRRLQLALSRADDARTASAWIEGFLAGGGAMLVHDAGLLSALDEWLTGLDPEAFVGVLPLVRRTFSTMSAPERRAIGDAVRAPSGKARPRTVGDRDDATGVRYDAGRGARALALVNAIFGARP